MSARCCGFLFFVLILVFIVRFFGHDAYSACKHCASGYALSFSFDYILTISLYFSCIYISHASLTCTQFMPRMNWPDSLEDMRACL